MHCEKYRNFHTRKLGENYGIFHSDRDIDQISSKK